MTGAPGRRSFLVAGLVGGAAAVGGGTLLGSYVRGRGGPVFGMLQAVRADYERLADSGVRAVTVGTPWSRIEPTQGQFDDAALDEALGDCEAARRAGLQVFLSPGLQYTPDWVFDDLGAARFTDQRGGRWYGDVGEDVPDAVFDTRVRDVQADYLARLGRGMSGVDLAAVRVGGLARGELHYPFRADEDDTIWAFSEPAQQDCPVPGYVPGSDAPTEEVAAFVEWYLAALSDHAVWQVERSRESFGDAPDMVVLLPSWGLRPGEVTDAVERGLDGTTHAESNRTLMEGLDWERQVAALAPLPGVATCTTWLDPPDQGPGRQQVSPGRYLSALSERHGLRMWGENTGGNDEEDLRRCTRRVVDLDMPGLFWMGADQLGRDGNATLEDYRAASAEARARWREQ